MLYICIPLINYKYRLISTPMSSIRFKIFWMLFLSLLGFLPVHAQLGQNKEGSLLYENEYSVGALVHTNGFGLNCEFLHFRHDGNYQLIDVNMYTVSHTKEYSLPNPNNPQSSDYVFGKLNSLFVINAGYGSRIVIAEKWTSSNVKVNFNYSFGPMIGLLKPIYYEIQSADPQGSNTYEKFRVNDDSQQARIIGTSFTKGFNEIRGIFGGHAKASMSFEWGPSETHYFSLETGITLDAFPVEVPIFAYINNQRVFTNMFVSFSFGKRY